MEIPQKYRLRLSFTAGVPAGIYLALRTAGGLDFYLDVGPPFGGTYTAGREVGLSLELVT